MEKWRKLNNDELHNLHSSPNIVGVIKSRSMRWAGYVSCIGEVFTGSLLELGSEETIGKT
jgi:hypothetical protein